MGQGFAALKTSSVLDLRHNTEQILSLVENLLQHNHIIHLNVNLDKQCIIPDIIKCIQNAEFAELLRSEASISIATRSSKKCFILFACIRLNGVGNITPGLRILALIYQSEGYSVRERPE